MKRIPLLSIALTLFFVAGLLLLFPYEVVGLGVLLVALVTAQVVIVRRHLHPFEPSRARAFEKPNLGEPNTPRAESFARAAGRPPAPEHQPPPPAGGEAPAAPELPVDTEVFSRFRAQLEAAEQTAPGGEPAPPQPEPEDRVAISARARRKNVPRAKAEPDAAKLFDDLVPQPPTKANARKEKPGAKAAARESAPQPDPAPPKSAAPAAKGKKAPAAAKPDPVSPMAEDGAMLLKMAEDALDKGDRAGAQAGLEQALARFAEGGQPPPWRARLAQARLAVMEGDLPTALAGFEHVLAQAHQHLEEADVLAHIDKLADPLPSPEGDRFRVSLLLKLLALQRQANNRPAMDRLYPLIQTAQEKAGDEEKLLQYFKNHLEIKKVMGDVEGQLDLIDRIGNRYYKRGDTETAKAFYEQGLKLREEQTAPPPGPDSRALS